MVMERVANALCISVDDLSEEGLAQYFREVLTPVGKQDLVDDKNLIIGAARDLIIDALGRTLKKEGRRIGVGPIVNLDGYNSSLKDLLCPDGGRLSDLEQLMIAVGQKAARSKGLYDGFEEGMLKFTEAGVEDYSARH